MSKGTYPEDYDASVWVFNGWQASIRIDGEVGLLLDFLHVGGFNDTRNAQLFNKNGDLDGVWSWAMAVKFYWLHIEEDESEKL